MRGLASGLAAAVACAPAAALAYEHVETSTGKPAHWARACVPWWLHEDVPDGLSREAVLGALRQAFGRWNAVETSYVRFQERGATCVDRAGSDAPLGRENVLVFRETDWPHSRFTVALTSLTYNGETGVIIDADIEMNARHFRFDTAGAADAFDLTLTLTHEAGHMLGLDHTDEKDAVMHHKATPGEQLGGGLHPDDQAGVSATHPLSAAPASTCDPAAPVAPLEAPHCPADPKPDESCAGGQGGADLAPVLVLVGLGLTLRARRRARCA